MVMYPSPKESLPEVWYLYNADERPVLVFSEGDIDTITFQRAVFFAFGREVDHEDITRGYLDQSCTVKEIDSEEVFQAHFSETKKGDDPIKVTVGKLRRPVFITRR